MTNENPIPPDKQVNHLILLVGGNPLPNAVAGLTLCKEGGQITLVQSKATFPIARRLATWFSKRGFKPPILKETKESEANAIYTAVSSALNQANQSSVGLHYTGGTKAMSVHAYYAVKHWAKERGIQPSFSYLDARTLEMVFAPEHPEGGELSQEESLKYMSRISLDDLFDLHGWSLKTLPTKDPYLPQTSQALLQVYQDEQALVDWEEWKANILHKECRRPDKPDRWKSQGQLRQIKLPWPIENTLQGVTQALEQELTQDSQFLNLAEAAKTCNHRKIESFCKWLDGGYWLETVTLEAFYTIAETCHLRDILMNLSPKLPSYKTDFELDVVALRGYQLFACSCGTDSKNPKLKLKLFEAYVRAQQLGGDEARIALVSFSDDPDGLEREMQQGLNIEGQIKVFGAEHLNNLADELQKWIDTSVEA